MVTSRLLQHRSRGTAPGFTLTELLVVLLIMVLITGTAVLSLTRLGKAGGVSAGTRGVVNAIESARQTAITVRRKARVVFERSSAFTSDESTAANWRRNWYTAYRVVVEDTTFNTELFPNAWTWTIGYHRAHRLPHGTGFLFDGAVWAATSTPILCYYSSDRSVTYTNDLGVGVYITPFNTGGGNNNVSSIASGGPAIEFNALGEATYNGTVTVAIVSSGTALLSTNSGNFAHIIVEKGSARVRVVRP